MRTAISTHSWRFDGRSVVGAPQNRPASRASTRLLSCSASAGELRPERVSTALAALRSRSQMMWKIAALVILGAIPASSSQARSSFAVPTPGLVENLNRQHHRGDWLRVTTDSARYEVRAREFGAQGLSGISSRRRSPAAPNC